MVFLLMKDPLELFVMRREFLPEPGCLSRCVMTYKQALESDVNTHSFLPIK